MNGCHMHERDVSRSQVSQPSLVRFITAVLLNAWMDSLYKKYVLNFLLKVTSDRKKEKKEKDKAKKEKDKKKERKKK